MSSAKLNVDQLYRVGQQLGAPWRRLVATIELWRERARGRKALSHLDPLMQRDLGLSDAEIWNEANKPFWRA